MDRSDQQRTAKGDRLRRIAAFVPDSIRRNLTKKLLILLLVGAMVSGAMAVFMYGEIDDGLTEQTNDQVKSDTAVQAELYASWLSERWSTLDALASSQEINSESPTLIHQWLVNIRGQTSDDIEMLFVAESDTGTVLATVETVNPEQNLYESGLNETVASRNIFISKQPVEIDGENMTLIGARSGSRLLVGAVPPDTEVVRRQAFDGTETALRSLDGQRLLGNTTSENIDLPDHEEGGNKTTTVETQNRILGIRVIAHDELTADPINTYDEPTSVGTVVVTSVPKEVAFETQQGISRDIGVAFSITFILLIGTAAVAMRSVTSEIETLSQKAQAISDGSFDIDISTTRIDEMGILYTSVDKMRDSLQTRLKQSREREQKLQELNTRLKLALEETNTGVWEWDLDTDDVIWDETSDQLFGYDSGDFPGTFAGFADRVPDEDLAEVHGAVDHAIETGEQYRAEFRVQPPEGDQRWLQARGVVQHDDEGKPDRMIGVQTDITDRKEREQELRETKQELEQSNEKLDQFAYVASHDLQEPLRMIKSYMELLEVELGDELDEETQEYMDFAADGAERMQAMIEGLLQYSRVQTDGDPFETVDSDAVLDETLQDLELKIADSGAEITRDTLPTVTADRNQLGQVFQNLIKNAVEHGDENTVVEITATERDGETEFAIADNGPGIPEDRQDDIFAIFDKGGDSEGTGIGLAVCQQVVERHGGEIRVDSSEGEGTTFRFTIPTEPDQ